MNMFFMKKEYIIVRIDASHDGSPYVVLSLSSSKDIKENNRPLSSPFGTNMVGFSNMDDMMRGLNKMLSGGALGSSGAITSMKLDIHEYKELNLSVGDKVYLELTKAENLGI